MNETKYQRMTVDVKDLRVGDVLIREAAGLRGERWTLVAIDHADRGGSVVGMGGLTERKSVFYDLADPPVVIDRPVPAVEQEWRRVDGHDIVVGDFVRFVDDASGARPAFRVEGYISNGAQGSGRAGVAPGHWERLEAPSVDESGDAAAVRRILAALRAGPGATVEATAKRPIHAGQAVTLDDVVVGANTVMSYANIAAGTSTARVCARDLRVGDAVLRFEMAYTVMRVTPEADGRVRVDLGNAAPMRFSGDELMVVRVPRPAPADPLAEVRVQAKLFLDIGTDPRVVLGVLDDFIAVIANGAKGVNADCFRQWVAQRVVHREPAERGGRCDHGHSLLPGACTACAIVLARPDAAPIESGTADAWDAVNFDG
jgi:hypothetical protein